jgi:hypothetical protein
MPIYNWSEMFAKEDLGHLFVKYRKNIYSVRLQKKSDKMMNEYIQKVGLSKKYLNYIKELQRGQKHKNKFIDGDDVSGTFAELSDKNLNDFFKDFGKDEKQKIELVRTCSAMEKYQGVEIDPKVINVLKFHAILKNINEDAARNKT